MKPTTTTQVVEQAVTKHIREGGFDKLVERILSKQALSFGICTAREAARLLKCSTDTFRRMGLPVIRLCDKTYRYRLSDIEKHLEKRTSK